MFAILALAGDLGCSGGPTLVGMIADRFGDDIKTGILAAVGIPFILFTGLILLKIHKKRQN